MMTSLALALQGIVDVYHIRRMDFVDVKFYADELAKVLEKRKNKRLGR